MRYFPHFFIFIFSFLNNGVPIVHQFAVHLTSHASRVFVRTDYRIERESAKFLFAANMLVSLLKRNGFSAVANLLFWQKTMKKNCIKIRHLEISYCLLSVSAVFGVLILR